MSDADNEIRKLFEAREYVVERAIAMLSTMGLSTMAEPVDRATTARRQTAVRRLIRRLQNELENP